MDKKEVILNDKLVAEAVAKHEAEMEDLKKPVTQAEAEAFVRSLDDHDLSKLLPAGTVVGTVNFAVKKGVRQSYGFISTAFDSIFVPPFLMEGHKDGDRVAAQVASPVASPCKVIGAREPRPSATKMVDVWKYVDWHKDEIYGIATAELKARRDRELEWMMGKDPTDGWDELKARAKAMGFTLVQVVYCTDSFNYGGRGADTYVFADEDREKLNDTTAAQLLTALGGRHASTANDGPYEHGNDRITVVTYKTGFVNIWTGPFAD